MPQALAATMLVSVAVPVLWGEFWTVAAGYLAVFVGYTLSKATGDEGV